MLCASFDSVAFSVEPIAYTPSRRADKAARGGGADRFIPHIQGLRAIAVLLVVLYHFWPGRLTGGYIGVDVFFVISGFLITGHIARELLGTGTVKLGQFWARRARRLLPASLLVLLFCAIAAATPFLVPLSEMPSELSEIAASTFYVQNWFLAINSADYFGHGEATMVQHYWSLSLEEQFYIVWPLLMLLAAWLAVKFFRGQRLRMIVIVLGAVTAASFVLCVVYTMADPAAAYFVTFGRMWQFGVGAAIALVPALRVNHPVVSFVLGWAGIIAVLYAGATFDGQTLFPGYAAALPTLGTAAVIAASNTERWWYPTRVLALRPMQFVGDISYSLYLWHWPLIIIAPTVPFWGLTIYHRVSLLFLCFLLAWLTKRFVENPARSWKPLTSRPPRVTLWLSLGAMLFVGAVTLGAWLANATAYERGVETLQEVRDNPPPCFGAGFADPGCENAAGHDTILPSPDFARADRSGHNECFMQLNDPRPISCEFGSREPDAPRVLLIGDSHAHQLLSTFQSMAESEGWHLTTFFKGGCAWNTTPVDRPGAFGTACTQWRGDVQAQLDDMDFDVVFTAAYSDADYSAEGFASSYDAAVAGFRGAWQTMTERGVPVVTIVDHPFWDADPNRCLRIRDQASCVGLRADMLTDKDPTRGAAEGMPSVTLLDFTDVYCDDMLCYPVVAGANVYRDRDHLTVTFANTLLPQIRAALQTAMAR